MELDPGRRDLVFESVARGFGSGLGLGLELRFGLDPEGDIGQRSLAQLEA